MYAINYNSTKKYLSKTGELVYLRQRKSLLTFDTWKEATEYITSHYDEYEEMYYTASEVTNENTRN